MSLGSKRFRGGWVFLEHKQSMHVFLNHKDFFPSFFFLVLVCFVFLLGGGSSGPFFFSKMVCFFVK